MTDQDERPADSKFREVSYARHAASYDEYMPGRSRATMGQSWTRTDTVDAWRHERMHETLEPLLQNDSGATWLTVGDGRYGTDATYLTRMGATVLATDVSDVLLREAQLAGLIPAFQQENLEHLSFEDNSFDYVLCKESLHHLPRPMVGLYEMIRVARRAAILIEPTDRFIGDSLGRAIGGTMIDLLRLVTRRNVQRHAYEESGNYTYTFSRREIEKAALGLNLPSMAVRGFNDIYHEAGSREVASRDSVLLSNVRRRMAVRDFLSKVGLYEPNMFAAIVFKKRPGREVRMALTSARFRFMELPANPYVELASDECT